MKHRDGGFTLLEILVALVVFSLLIVGLTQGVRFGLVAWQTQMNRLDARDDLDAVDRTLRQLIAAMYPGNGTVSANIQGLPNLLAFTTRLPAGADSLPVAGMLTDMNDVAILVDGQQNLLLRWAPHVHAVLFVAPPRPLQAVLLRKVVRIEFAYWRPTGGAVGVWQQDWSESGPPGLIRIHLVFAKDDPRRWPDIIAAPMRQ